MINQASKPQAVIKLWKCQLEEPKFNQANPSVTIFDKGTSMSISVFSHVCAYSKCLFVLAPKFSQLLNIL